MSFNATKWAKKHKLRSSVKNLLLALADHANDQNLCWPSHKKLEQTTNLERKTIIRGLAELKKLNLISDTGKRTGKSGCIKIYRINLDDGVGDEKGDMVSPFQSSRFVPTNIPKTDFNNPALSVQQSPKGNTEPLPNHQSTIKEPSGGCLQRGLRGNGPYGIEPFINTEEDFVQIRRLAPGWDKYTLFRMFDEHFEGRGELRNPQAAFFGWLQRFTKGQPPKGSHQQFGDAW